MTGNIFFRVFPEYISKYSDKVDELKRNVNIFTPLSIFFGICWWIVIFFNLILGLVFLVVWLISVFNLEFFNKELKRVLKANEESELYSKKLNEILTRSEEIVHEILPYFETSAQKCIEIAKVDFAENAISPFWDKIEEVSNFLGCYKEAVDQLVYNYEIYSKVLDGKKHNFPTPFPFGTNIYISQTILEDFSTIIRKAQSKFEFANIWEHRKTQKILIAGFRTLEQAINNMRDAIVVAINNLKRSIKSDFRQLQNIQLEQLKSFESSHRTLNDTLTSMDTKLYYMQYHKQPTTPFIRHLID